MKQLIQSLKCSAIAALAIALTPNDATAIFNPNPTSTSIPPNVLANQSPPKSPDTGTPQTGNGAATRQDSNCLEKQSPFVAFLPEEANIDAPSTLLWAYLPYASEEIHTLRFFILDEESGEYILPPTTIPLSETPGFVSLPFPPLETGKQYVWKLSMICDADDPEDQISRSGVVRPVASPEPSWYAEFNRLAQLRRSDAADEAILAEWTRLLESFNLGELVAEPMTNCCSRDEVDS